MIEVLLNNAVTFGKCIIQVQFSNVFNNVRLVLLGNTLMHAVLVKQSNFC